MLKKTKQILNFIQPNGNIKISENFNAASSPILFILDKNSFVNKVVDFF